MKVNLFIVGQPKSGTTALASFLGQHPDICMSRPKEPSYFATDLIAESDKFLDKKHPFVRTEQEYHDLFKHCNQSKFFGDSSTNYLYSHEAAANIYKYNPEAKIIMLLRNPVDLMHSLHMQYINEAREDIADFAAALAAQEDRAKGRKIPKNAVIPSYFQYNAWAKYAEQIVRYQKIFPKENILILVFEAFKNDNAAAYESVLKHIDAKLYEASFTNIHGSKEPRSKHLNRIFNNQTFKNLVHKTLGQQRYTQVRDKVADIMMRSQKRQPLDPELRRKLAKQLQREVKLAGKVTGLPLDRIWSF